MFTTDWKFDFSTLPRWDNREKIPYIHDEYPAYHMNRNHWLTVALDGRMDEDTMEFLLGISYDLTKGKNK